MQNDNSLEDQIYATRRMMWQRFTKLSFWGCVGVVALLLFLAFIWPRV